MLGRQPHSKRQILFADNKEAVLDSDLALRTAVKSDAKTLAFGSPITFFYDKAVSKFDMDETSKLDVGIALQKNSEFRFEHRPIFSILNQKVLAGKFLLMLWK